MQERSPLSTGDYFCAYIVRLYAILRHLLQREESACGDILAELPFPAVHLGISCVHFLCDWHIHIVYGDNIGDDISVLVLNPSVIAIFLPFYL